MPHRLPVVVPALGLLLLAAPGLAQTGPGGGPRGGPGAAMMAPRSLESVPVWADRIFERLDANQDDALTGDELAPLSQGPLGAMGGARLRTIIARSDASNDGRISREELRAGIERMFRRMDVNGDGPLSDDELPEPPAPPRPPAIPMPAPEPMTMPPMPGG